MKKFIILSFILIFTAVTINAQSAISLSGKNLIKIAPDVNATIINNYQSNSKDVVYNPSDSPDPTTWTSNSYTELGWTDIEVTETDLISVVTIDYTWDTNIGYAMGSFHLESPTGTNKVFASGYPGGLYSISMIDFYGESMNGTWILWIEDGWGEGELQATDITLTFHSQLAHDHGVTGIYPEYIPSGESAVPQVEVYNFGTNDEDSYSVNLTDGAVYNETVNITNSISSNTSAIIDFPLWSPADGVYTLTASVTLASDENLSNNTIEDMCHASTGDYIQETVYAYDGWGPNSHHVLEIPIETGIINPIDNPEIGSFICSGEFINGVLYGIQVPSNDVYIIFADGNAAKVGSLTGITPGYWVWGLAYDQINDDLYVCANLVLSYGTSFYLVDDEWNCNFLGYSNKKFFGLATDAVGDLYGIDLYSNDFWSINKTNGTPTLIGSLGYEINWEQDIGGDKVNDIIYGCISLDESTSLFGTINKKTGAFTPINNFLGGLITMCAVFPGEATKAHVTFTIDNSANTNYTGFALKGSWDADGNYDPTWNSGEEHKDFYDDGTHGDTVAGDDIWSVMVLLVPDGGTNTWEWGVNDQDGNLIEGNIEFSVPDVSAQTLPYTIVVEINEISNNILNIYPNPSNGIFYIHCNNQDKYTLEISDINGKLIFTQKTLNENLRVDISKFSKGVYFIKLKSDSAIKFGKIILK